MKNTNKIALFTYMSQKTTLFPLMVILGFLSLPLPSIAVGDRDRKYENCAELQTYLNDKHPQDRYESFEKVTMMRKTLNPLFRSYVVYCNGGVVTTTEVEGIRVCRGYIAYSYEPTRADARHFVGWATMGNDTAANEGYYCRWKEKFPPIYSQ